MGSHKRSQRTQKQHQQFRPRNTRSSKPRLLSDPVHNTRLLTEQLKALGLYAAPTLGDGNCLFRALSDQLYGSPSKHHQLRQDICNWIATHKQRYEPFVDDERGIDVHLQCMRENATYGGHMELSAFAHLTRRNVKVIQPGLVYVINWSAGWDSVDIASSSPYPSSSSSSSSSLATPDEDDRRRSTSTSGKKGKSASTWETPIEDEDAEELPETVYVAYHDWEHFSSIRNLNGPHTGPPRVCETPPQTVPPPPTPPPPDKPKSKVTKVKLKLPTAPTTGDGTTSSEVSKQPDEESATPSQSQSQTAAQPQSSLAPSDPSEIPLPSSRSVSPNPSASVTTTTDPSHVSTANTTPAPPSSIAGVSPPVRDGTPSSVITSTTVATTTTTTTTTSTTPTTAATPQAEAPRITRSPKRSFDESSNGSTGDDGPPPEESVAKRTRSSLGGSSRPVSKTSAPASSSSPRKPTSRASASAAGKPTSKMSVSSKPVSRARSARADAGDGMDVDQGGDEDAEGETDNELDGEGEDDDDAEVGVEVVSASASQSQSQDGDGDNDDGEDGEGDEDVEMEESRHGSVEPVTAPAAAKSKTTGVVGKKGSKRYQQQQQLLQQGGDSASAPLPSKPPSKSKADAQDKPLTRRQRKTLGLPKARRIIARPGVVPVGGDGIVTRSRAAKYKADNTRVTRSSTRAAAKDKSTTSPSAKRGSTRRAGEGSDNDGSGEDDDDDDEDESRQEWRRNGVGRVDVRGFRELRI